MTTPSFSVDWFSNNISMWRKYLRKYTGKGDVRALEVGTYEGRSAIWLLDNVLTGSNVRLNCIDNFSEKHRHTRGDVKTTLIKNMAPYKGKFKLFEGDSSTMLKSPAIMKEQYDIIYIDANHHSRHVLEDLVLCFPLLKVGGIMIIDDNTDNKEHDNNCPKPGIAAFLNAFANEVKVINSRWQVMLTKRDKPLPKKPCHSEFWP